MKIIKIGRSSNNDIVINDAQVSRTHCQIIEDDHGYFRLVDTNSANGTYVNGVRRQGEVRLNQSDIVRIGNTTLPWQTYFNNAQEGTVVGGGYSGGRGDIVINNGSNNINGGGNYPPQTKPDNFLVWAILGTIFCCLPFGIASIVHASRVDSRWSAGDYTGAIDSAQKARTWFWWAFGIGLVVSIIYFIVYFVAGVASVL